MENAIVQSITSVDYAHPSEHAEQGPSGDLVARDDEDTEVNTVIDRDRTHSTPISANASPLSRLPPELLGHLLTHIPPAELQRTTLALHQVFPALNLAEQFLWRHVVVRRGEQLMPLWRAAKVRGQDREPRNVRSFTMESWKGDADILNNSLRCLPDITNFVLNMGTNFAPEHLEEMFEDHRPGLQRLELRFRPYVEQASYYQFLKGSYFDTAIETLAKSWPETPEFTRLSIVQDIPPRGTAPSTALQSVVPSTVASPTVSKLPSAATSVAPSVLPSVVPSAATSKLNSPRIVSSTPVTATSIADTMAELALDSSSDTDSSGYSTPPTSQSDSPVEPKGYSGHGPFPYLADKLGWARPRSFAQPIVFFDIKCLAKFGIAPVARHLTHLRLRVPSRDLISVLISQPPSRMSLFPSLKYLDISTTNVRLDASLTTLLKNYEHLEHLVMDRVNLFGFQAKDKGMEMCRELGGMVLSAGLARGKERERMIAAWDVSERTRVAIAEASRRSNQSTAASDPGQVGESAGALGGDIAVTDGAVISRARRGHRSAAQSTFSLRDRPSRLRSTTSASATLPPNTTLPPTDRLYLVLPPLPSLRTLSIGGEAHHVPPHRVRDWVGEFHSGWREGLSKVLGWAGHVGERYERAKKKADEWVIQDMRSSAASTSAGGNADKNGNLKGKGRALPKPSTTKPPTDVRLFRFPLPHETPDQPYDPTDPATGLIELRPEGREYLDIYKSAIGDAEMYANDHSYAPPCVLCMVPDCEGPMRKCDDGSGGLRVDGRGGMEGMHVKGCGHEVGRRTWGWEGMD